MIDRDLFCNILYTTFNHSELEILLDVIERRENTKVFIIDYLNETVLIYDTVDDLYITWYKLTHIGRDIATNIPDVETLEHFIYELYAQIFEY